MPVPYSTILDWLIDEGSAAVPGEDEQIRFALSQNGVTALPDRARQQLRSAVGNIGPVFLPWTKTSTVLLYASWRDEVERLKLRVALFRLEENGGVVGRAFRFESPDGADGRHDHALYHLQPVSTLEGPSGAPIPGIVDAVMDDEPTVPLPVTSSLELVTCALVSVYGKAWVRQESNRQGNRLRTPLDRVVGAATRGAGD